MRLIDADALEKTGIPFAMRGGAIFIALGSVRTAPTIEAEPVRHGRWDAKIMKDIGTYTVYWCSECNCYSYFKYNYCPNCGAKMRGGTDE